MSDLISRQAAIDAVKGRFSMPVDNLIAEVIGQLPSVQPQRQTGRCVWCDGIEGRRLRIEFYWIDDKGYTASFSEPHVVASGIAKYCPECGRKLNMEVEHENP